MSRFANVKTVVSHLPGHNGKEFKRPVNPFILQWKKHAFEGMLHDYNTRNSALFYKGVAENQLNNIGNAFWRGFYNQPCYWIDLETPLGVVLTAGRKIGKAVLGPGWALGK